MFFGVDTQDTHDALCARACGGKVGAGTVEAEEDICVGKVHRWVGSVGLSCCLRGQISRIDKQETEQPYVSFCLHVLAGGMCVPNLPC
jgi:hypothetical protein